MHEMHKRETSTWHRMTDEGHLESKTKMMDESQSCLATNSKIKNERQMKQHKSNYKWRTTRAVHAIPRIRDRRRHDAEWEARSQATRVRGLRGPTRARGDFTGAPRTGGFQKGPSLIDKFGNILLVSQTHFSSNFSAPVVSTLRQRFPTVSSSFLF